MINSVVGWVTSIVLLLATVLSILAVLHSHRNPKAPLARKLAQGCGVAVLVAVLTAVVGYLSVLFGAAETLEQVGPAGRATFMARIISEGINTAAFAVVALLVPTVCMIYLFLRAGRLEKEAQEGAPQQGEDPEG